MTENDFINKDLQEKALEQQQEQLRNLELYHWLKENGYIIFETITGSQAHGTSTPKSDIDKAFVYILPENDILGIKYKEQLKIHADFMGYEIRRFLELLKKNNPTVLELLYSPEDCVLIKHSSFQKLIEIRDSFITKQCANSFYGYAKQQREKAEGLEKMQNWEGLRVVRKNPIDFCYVPEGYDAIPIINWLEKRVLEQLFCALTKLPHCKDLYAVFYDHEAHKCFSPSIEESEREKYKFEKKSRGESMGLGYKGIAFEDSTDIRLSNIAIEERKNSICHISYNKDGYVKNCKDFNKYQKWLEERNEARWVEVEGHGQKIDGKNMMHFMRLVLIGREIAQGKGINIRREDAEELLKIRRGEVSLTALFEKSEEILSEMKALFYDSNLPNELDNEFLHNLLVNIRTDFYNKEFEGKYNFEQENEFMLKTYGGKSELHHFLFEVTNDKIGELFNGDFKRFYDDSSNKFIIWGLNQFTNLWPKTKNLENGKTERVSMERFSVISIDREKVSVMAGGDWQQPISFDIVLWKEKQLVPINIKFVDNWNDGLDQSDVIKALQIISA